MTGKSKVTQEFAAVHSDTDDAVGVFDPQKSNPDKSWFVALVRHNTEKKIQEQLAGQGFEVYVASQPRLRITPSGRKKWIDALVIHSKIFIRCTEAQRLQVVNHPYIYRFLTNPSGELTHGHKPLAVIPDAEMDVLRYMLGQSDYPVSFEDYHYLPDSEVKIIRGSLKGLQGRVLQSEDNNKDVLIQIEFLGCAKVTIPASDITLLSTPPPINPKL